MRLRDILEDIEILETKGNIDFDKDYENIYYNSKVVNKDGIFVAIVGYLTDGHKYIKDAIKNGASLAIVENFVNEDINQIKVKNSRYALADMGNNFYNKPSKKIKIVGITATNGKTTTSFMVDKIFRDTGLKTGLVGTVYTKYDDVVIPSILTTPESFDLQGIFSDMIKKKIEIATMEVSSSAEELSRVKNVDFDIVCFNNFSEDHIEQHGSLENYYKAKSKLILEAKKDAISILNMDFEEIKILRDKTQSKVLTYSLSSDIYDFSISNLDLSTGSGKFNFNINRDIDLGDIVLKKGSFKINLKVAGYSSVMNSVVAIIVALCQGVDIKTIQNSINDFSGVERRFELLLDNEFKVIDDHYANVKNIDVTMETLSKMEFNNLKMLYAIRGSRGVELNKQTAILTAKWLKKLGEDHLYVTLSKDSVSKKDEVLEKELEVFSEVMKEYGIKFTLYDNLKDGVISVLRDINKGDLILLAGCQGMDKAAKYMYDYLKTTNIKISGLKDKIINRIC